MVRARNKLNVKQVAKLEKPGVYSDGGGLYLRIRKTGSRSWLFIYTWQGKRRELGLGSDLNVSLAMAREAASAARSRCMAGENPTYDRLGKSDTIAPTVTFGEFAESWLDQIDQGFRNTKHRQQWRSTLSTYCKNIMSLPIKDVSTHDVIDALRPIWLTKAETASRLRGRIERILDAAKISGHRDGENPARSRGHLDLLLPKASKKLVKHHPALPFGQIGEFLRALRQRSGTAARALEFTVLTAARSGEVRGMTWSEVNFSERLWTVPGERMKSSVTHQVPLSDEALDVLDEMKASINPQSETVFASARGGSLSDMVLTAVLRRMNRGDITVHGFRSTFRDWAGETTSFGREEIEMALAHTIQSATERAYRRGRALFKRRALMQDWAAFCFQPQPGIDTAG